MTAAEQRIFLARQDQLQQALDFVEGLCEQQGVSLRDSMRVILIVEELFSNTLKHGHRGDADAPVRITLQVDAAHLMLCYEDNAPPFDPLRYLRESPPSLDVTLDQRPDGKMGLRLVADMAQTSDYALVDGFNCLRLVFLRDG